MEPYTGSLSKWSSTKRRHCVHTTLWKTTQLNTTKETGKSNSSGQERGLVPGQWHNLLFAWKLPRSTASTWAEPMAL